MTIYTAHLTKSSFCPYNKIEFDDRSKDLYLKKSYKKIFSENLNNNYPILIAIIFEANNKGKYSISEGKLIYSKIVKKEIMEFLSVIYCELRDSIPENKKIFFPIAFHGFIHSPYVKALINGNYEDPIEQYKIYIYYKNLDLENEANRWLKKSAECGCVLSQKILAKSYLKSTEQKKIKEGIEFIKKHSLTTDSNIQYLLALSYKKKSCLEKAFKYFLAASENEHEKAMLELADCYFFGMGTSKNEKESFKWLTKAALNGNVKAQMTLGFAYYTNKIDGDIGQACYWFNLASEEDADALYFLGKIYENKYRNLKKACKYYNLSQDENYRSKLALARLYFQEASFSENYTLSLKLLISVFNSEFNNEKALLETKNLFNEYYYEFMEIPIESLGPKEIINSLMWHKTAFKLKHSKSFENFKKFYEYIFSNLLNSIYPSDQKKWVLFATNNYPEFILAHYHLGIMTKNIDFYKSYSHLKKAADSNFKPAQIELAHLVEENQFLKIDHLKYYS